MRFGIALLGAQITIEQLLGLGLTPIVIVLVGVPATILFGYLCGKWLKLGKYQSILSGASVGICGASAALAVSVVLPQDKESEKSLIFTVICVTSLSTLAMIGYPLIVDTLGLDDTESGIFLGATIHGVAQVVGTGYMLSDNVGDIAPFTKLLRVVILVPVVVLISLIVARKGTANTKQKASSLPLPGFLISFVIIVIINSTGWLPEVVTGPMMELSRWCLIIAKVGIGMKASFKELAAMGWRPMLLMIADCYLAMTRPRAFRSRVLPKEALREIFQERGNTIGDELARLFINTLGIYSAGSLVKLKNGVRALVTGQTRNLSEPKLTLLTDKTGTPLSPSNRIRTNEGGGKIVGLL